MTENTRQREVVEGLIKENTDLKKLVDKLKTVARAAELWTNKWEANEIDEDAKELRDVKTALAALKEAP